MDTTLKSYLSENRDFIAIPEATWDMAENLVSVVLMGKKYSLSSELENVGVQLLLAGQVQDKDRLSVDQLCEKNELPSIGVFKSMSTPDVAKKIFRK